MLEETSKYFNTKFEPQGKDEESCYQVEQILSLLCKFVTLTLHENYVKGLRVTETVKQIKFEGNWGKLQANYWL